MYLSSLVVKFEMELFNCLEFLFLFSYRNINLLVIYKVELKRNVKYFISWLKFSNYLEFRLILGIRDYCSFVIIDLLFLNSFIFIVVWNEFFNNYIVL